MLRNVIYIIVLAVIAALCVWGWLFVGRCPRCKRHGLKETSGWEPSTRQRQLRCKHCQLKCGATAGAAIRGSSRQRHL